MFQYTGYSYNSNTWTIAFKYTDSNIFTFHSYFKIEEVFYQAHTILTTVQVYFDTEYINNEVFQPGPVHTHK